MTIASQSPRRARILAENGVDFEVVKTSAQEVSLPRDPERTVVENASRKLEACHSSPALAADTIVWFDGRIFGKPRDLAEAREFLRILSGQTHSVFTGVAYRDPSGGVRTACVRSDVTFRALSSETIDRYVDTVKPVDRAGAYDIDECGDMIVESYTGSYENIMGLPLEPLGDFGILA